MIRLQTRNDDDDDDDELALREKKMEKEKIHSEIDGPDHVMQERGPSTSSRSYNTFPALLWRTVESVDELVESLMR